MPDHFHLQLAAIGEFVQKELYPLEALTRGKPWTEVLPLLEEKRQLVQAQGWWTPQIPQAYGGMGLSLEQFGQVSERLGRSPFGHFVFNCAAPDAGNMEVLISHGSAEQQEVFLKPLLAGKIRSCFAMTEPDFAGSNPVLMGTTAVREGENYLLDGRKWFTTGADGSAFAIVMCVTNPAEKSPHRRASLLIVPTETPDFQQVRKISVMGEEGDANFSHSEILFEKCLVPAANLLGKEGEGFALAQERLGPGRIHHCMRWVGICERAFELMCRRAMSRELEPGVPLASRQTVQNWIAESRANINAARLMVLDAARKMDEHGAYAARTEVSLIKFFCAKVLQEVLDCAIQVHGALGISDDTPLAFWYRHERGARIYDGADEVHKTRVAKEILKNFS